MLRPLCLTVLGGAAMTADILDFHQLRVQVGTHPGLDEVEERGVTTGIADRSQGAFAAGYMFGARLAQGSRFGLAIGGQLLVARAEGVYDAPASPSGNPNTNNNFNSLGSAGDRIAASVRTSPGRTAPSGSYTWESSIVALGLTPRLTWAPIDALRLEAGPSLYLGTSRNRVSGWNDATGTFGAIGLDLAGYWAATPHLALGLELGLLGQSIVQETSVAGGTAYDTTVSGGGGRIALALAITF